MYGVLCMFAVGEMGTKDLGRILRRSRLAIRRGCRDMDMGRFYGSRIGVESN